MISRYERLVAPTADELLAAMNEMGADGWSALSAPTVQLRYPSEESWSVWMEKVRRGP